MGSRADCVACDDCVILCESKSSDCSSLCVLSYQCTICVRVVMRESDEFRLYGSNRCVNSRGVRLLSTGENFSGVFRIGVVCSKGGGLCSALCSVCTMYEIILVEMKSISFYDCDCLA